jgi:hypothetical protein
MLLISQHMLMRLRQGLATFFESRHTFRLSHDQNQTQHAVHDIECRRGTAAAHGLCIPRLRHKEVDIFLWYFDI